MASAQFNASMQIAGLSITRNGAATADNANAWDPAVPAGDAGTLTTRTDAETGSITMASGSHGVSTSDVVDIFWSGGARFGVTVGTVSGTTVPIGADNSGTGDDLPTASTSLVVSVPVTVNAAIDGDAVAKLAIKQFFATTDEVAQSRIVFYDSGDAAIASLTLEANVARYWNIDDGDDNPFTGNPVTYAKVSNGSATNGATLQLAVLQDSTP